MAANSRNGAADGSSATPSVWISPMASAASRVPTMDPRPPRTTTTRDSSSTVSAVSVPGPMIGAPRTPAAPASAPPAASTPTRIRAGLTPEAGDHLRVVDGGPDQHPGPGPSHRQVEPDGEHRGHRDEDQPVRGVAVAGDDHRPVEGGGHPDLRIVRAEAGDEQAAAGQRHPEGQQRLREVVARGRPG